MKDPRKEPDPAGTNTGFLRLGMATADDILRDALKNYRDNGNTNQAAAVAFYAILSLIPLFILTVIVLGRVLGSYPAIQHNLLQAVEGSHPYFSGPFLSQLGRIEQKKIVLGWAGIISLFWLSAMIFSAIEKALNMIFRAQAYRNYIVAKLLALSMIPLGWAISVASVGITYGANILVAQSLTAGDAGFAVAFLATFLFGYAVPYLLTASFGAVVYKVVPNIRVSLATAVTGGAVFALLVEVAKHVFTWYVSNYTRYNVIFGSLETMVILIIWVFYVALIFLFCAELMASYERRDLLLLKGAFLEKDTGHLRVNERLFRKFGRKFSAGTHIFREGDTGREMYYLLKGRIRVEKRDGVITRVLAEMGPGEYLGEMAALIESPRTASAFVTEDSHVAVIDADTFRDLLRESGEVSLFMLREFSYRVKHTSEALEKLGQAWLDLMIVIYFLREWPFREGIDHAEKIAGYAGKDPPEIRQALERLAQGNVLDMKDGRITGFRKEEAWRIARAQG
jgi:membrane protein